MKLLGRRLSTTSIGPFVPVSVLVLLVSLFYSYAGADLSTYAGIGVAGDWVVVEIPPCDLNNSEWCKQDQGLLQTGDRLLRIGNLTYAQSQQDRTQVQFGGYQPGDLVPITFVRAGTEHTIQWRMQGITTFVWLTRLSGFLIYIPFWLAGTLILFLLQPHDLRWGLLILFNYATALWLAAGLVSILQVAYSSLVLHAITWLLVPLYLHLHLTIPSPLFQSRQRAILLPLYAAATLLAALELLQLLPRQIVNVAYILVVLAAVVPLGLRVFVRSSEADRVSLRLMLAGIVLSLGPGFTLVVVPALFNVSMADNIAPDISVYAIALLPAFYIYAIYKRRLSTLEFRSNRLLGLYSFALLYATTFVLVFFFGARQFNISTESLAYSLAISVIFALLALAFYQRFQTLFDRLAYGAQHRPEEIVSIFANRISAALEHEPLVALLTRQLMPSLLIRQSALYTFCNQEAALLYASGVHPSPQLKRLDMLMGIIARAGRYIPPDSERQDEFEWVRLAIEIKAGDNPVGVWLLGRRDPDDFYPQTDIALLKTLANQVGLGLENARLYEGELMRREELSALFDLSRALADAAYDLQAILDLVTRRAVETLHITFALTALVEKDELVIRAGHPIRVLDHDLGLGRRLPLADMPFCQRVLNQNAGKVIVPASPEVTAAERDILFMGFAKTLCVIPVRAGEKRQGLLILGEARRDDREPFSPEKVLLAQSIADLTRSAIHRAGLFDELENSYLQTVLALASAVEAKDTYTANHAQRLAQMAIAVGAKLGMDERALEDLRYGAILHDIGKIGVPDSILQKPAKLDAEEWVAMRQHPSIGAHILSPIPRLAGASHIVCHHHERYDGTGYPDRLAGDEIPLGARILSVVDAYGAIIDKRNYKQARPHAEAIAEVIRCAGTQFDPRVVQVFLELFNDGHRIPVEPPVEAEIALQSQTPAAISAMTETITPA